MVHTGPIASMIYAIQIFMEVLIFSEWAARLAHA